MEAKMKGQHKNVKGGQMNAESSPICRR